MTDTFISVENLRSLDKSKVYVIDLQFILGDPKGGLRLYRESHIPNAVFWDLEKELTGEITERTGRHPLPDMHKFIELLKLRGVSPNKQIVIYDNAGGGYAARLWWMLNTLGYPHVAVLEGGIDAWKKKGYLIDSGENSVSHSSLTSLNLKLPSNWKGGQFPLIFSDEIKTNLGSLSLIDSRDLNRYRGIDSGPDPIAGTIPGSSHRHWKFNLNPEGTLRESEILKIEFRTIKEDSVFYCGSGVTACFNLLVQKHVTGKMGCLYAGSWSEWINVYPEIIEMKEEDDKN